VFCADTKALDGWPSPCGAALIEGMGMDWLTQTLPFNVCDAPKAHRGQTVLQASTCPFGASQTPDIGVCTSPARRLGFTLYP